METGELRVWNGAYGAPSLDPTSLQALVYVRINHLTSRIRIIYGLVPQWSPIPSYKKGKIQYDTAADIMQAIHGEQQGNDTDKKYYASETSRIEAYKSYATEVFGIAYQVIFWYNNENYIKVTKSYYYGLIPFPFKYFYVNNLTKYYFNQLNCIVNSDVQQEYLSTKMLKAEQCLGDISEILGTKPYLLGDHPCSLDAVFYSLLAPIYYAPLEKCDFQVKLKSHYNLSRYIVRITKTYFPDIKYEPSIKPKEDENDSAPWWQITLAGFSAFTVMCWFAYTKGLVRVVF